MPELGLSQKECIFLEEWLIPGLKRRKYKGSLDNLIVLESKVMLQN